VFWNCVSFSLRNLCLGGIRVTGEGAIRLMVVFTYNFCLLSTKSLVFVLEMGARKYAKNWNNQPDICNFSTCLSLYDLKARSGLVHRRL
jgi:hypothetical protein